MMSSLSRLFSLVKKTKSPLIMVDPATEEPYVLMDFSSYEELLALKTKVDDDYFNVTSKSSDDSEPGIEAVPMWKKDIAMNLRKKLSSPVDEAEPVPGLDREVVNMPGVEVDPTEIRE